MKKDKCISCENALINGENWCEHESYSNDICDQCFENHYGFCDQCGLLFRYYDEMSEGDLGVSCRKCLKVRNQMSSFIEASKKTEILECGILRLGFKNEQGC